MNIIKVKAASEIVLSDEISVAPTVIAAGEEFDVWSDALEGTKGLVAHYKGESFFVEQHEFQAI